MQRESRTIAVPEQLTELVRRTVDLRGPTGASRVLGVSRATLLGVLAGVGATRGSVAILREAYGRSELAREAAAVATSTGREVSR